MPQVDDCNDNTTETIGIGQAFARLKASYLSERHSEQLLFALLEEGSLEACGIPEYRDGGSTGDAIIEDIDKDFWLGIDADWDSSRLGLSTGRFSSSGQDLAASLYGDDDCDNRRRLNELTSGEKQQACRYYRNVQVSWTEIQANLRNLNISNEALQLRANGDLETQSGQKQAGRKMSAQWPVWISIACKLAYEHVIHKTSSANSIVESVMKHAPPDLSLAKTTAWPAAMAIVEAIEMSSVKHRFGELDAKPEPTGSKNGTF